MSQNIIVIVEQWIKKNPNIKTSEQKMLIEKARNYQAGIDMPECDERHIETIIREMT